MEKWRVVRQTFFFHLLPQLNLLCLKYAGPTPIWWHLEIGDSQRVPYSLKNDTNGWIPKMVIWKRWLLLTKAIFGIYVRFLGGAEGFPSLFHCKKRGHLEIGSLKFIFSLIKPGYFKRFLFRSFWQSQIIYDPILHSWRLFKNLPIQKGSDLQECDDQFIVLIWSSSLIIGFTPTQYSQWLRMTIYTFVR